MAKPFRGTINVDVTQSVPDWGPYTQPIAPEDTPPSSTSPPKHAWPSCGTEAAP